MVENHVKLATGDLLEQHARFAAKIERTENSVVVPHSQILEFALIDLCLGFIFNPMTHIIYSSETLLDFLQKTKGFVYSYKRFSHFCSLFKSKSRINALHRLFASSFSSVPCSLLFVLKYFHLSLSLHDYKDRLYAACRNHLPGKLHVILFISISRQVISLDGTEVHYDIFSLLHTLRQWSLQKHTGCKGNEERPEHGQLTKRSYSDYGYDWDISSLQEQKRNLLENKKNY